jgi:hypothetical protein
MEEGQEFESKRTPLPSVEKVWKANRYAVEKKYVDGTKPKEEAMQDAIRFGLTEMAVAVVESRATVNKDDRLEVLESITMWTDAIIAGEKGNGSELSQLISSAASVEEDDDFIKKYSKEEILAMTEEPDDETPALARGLRNLADSIK